MLTFLRRVIWRESWLRRRKKLVGESMIDDPDRTAPANTRPLDAPRQEPDMREPGAAPMRDRYHHGALRSALIEAAAAQIAVDGVENFSVKAAAERVGVSKTAPYRHFTDKADLVGHVAANGFEQLSQVCEAAREAHPPGSTERLVAMGQGYLDYVTDHPELYT